MNITRLLDKTEAYLFSTYFNLDYCHQGGAHYKYCGSVTILHGAEKGYTAKNLWITVK